MGTFADLCPEEWEQIFYSVNSIIQPSFFGLLVVLCAIVMDLMQDSFVSCNIVVCFSIFSSL